MIYEVVCTKHYFDVGLCIEINDQLKPKRVLSRASQYGSDTEYGGVEIQEWVNTGIFLSKDEWKNVSYEKTTDQILSELGVKKKIYSDRQTEFHSDNQIDYIRVALAIETLAYHDRNYLSKDFATSNARISEEVQALLIKAINMSEKGLSK